MGDFANLDAVGRAVGSDLGTSDWHLVTQGDVAKFADATNAREWIHVDERRAAEEGPFGRTVVHGYLTLGLATSFVTQLLDVRVLCSASTTAWTGSDSPPLCLWANESGRGADSFGPSR